MRNTKLHPLLKEYLNEEVEKMQHSLNLIASENYCSNQILKMNGSILTFKYAEGYPGKRYYRGCSVVDKIEQLAIDLFKELYGAEHANVQPHSGSQANAAAYQALVKPGDTILAMYLNDGGHLTHGHPKNFSGVFYNFINYKLNPDNEMLDYEAIRQLALEHQPKLIVAGASNYSHKIDFSKFREIADEVGAYLMVDMAHISGFIAAKLHPLPFPYADVVTTTTHKTMRGPRGGLILCKKKLKKKIDLAVFPGQQGGPLLHVIAGKAQAAYEALQPEFVEYQKQIIKNSQAMVKYFTDKGYKIVSKITENHLFTIDTKTSFGLTGKQAAEYLDKYNIVCNKNMIPNDTEKAFVTSGIRLGTPSVTSRGLKEADVTILAEIIHLFLSDINSEENRNLAIQKTKELTARFPIHEDKHY